MKFNKYFFGFIGVLFLSILIFNIANAETATSTIDFAGYYRSDGYARESTILINQNVGSLYYRSGITFTVPEIEGEITGGIFHAKSNGSCYLSCNETSVYSTNKYMDSNLSWTVAHTGVNWSSSGGDFDTLLDSGTVGNGSYYDFDISGLSLTSGNQYNLLLKYTNEASVTGANYISDFNNGSYIEITYTPSSSGGTTTTTTVLSNLTSYGLWGLVASSSMDIINSSVPFWEIALGIIFALFGLFFIIKAFSRPVKWLLKR